MAARNHQRFGGPHQQKGGVNIPKPKAAGGVDSKNRRSLDDIGNVVPRRGAVVDVKPLLPINHPVTRRGLIKYSCYLHRLPNFGHSVAIWDHNVCVGSHEDPASEYRICEWHSHIMFFDDEDGYLPEYVYGNYFERVVGDMGKMMNKVKVVVEEEEIEEVANSGLHDLIADPKDLSLGAGGRVPTAAI